MMRVLYVLLLLLVCISANWANEVSLQQLETQLTQTTNQQQKLKILEQLAEANLAIKDLGKADDYVKQAQDIAQQLGQQSQKAHLLDIQGRIFQSKYDYTNAMSKFVEALKIYSNLDDQKGIAHAKNSIGYLFFLQEDYVQAEENLKQALEIRTASKLGGAAQTNQYLGEVYLAQQIYGKALQYLQKAIDLKIEEEDAKGAAQIAKRIGNISSDLGDYDSALVYYQVCLDLHSSLGDQLNIAHDLNNIVLTNRAQREYDAALDINQAALDIYTAQKHPIGVSKAQRNFGMIYADLKDKTKAYQFLQQSETSLKKLELEPDVPIIYNDLAKTYQRLGNYEDAFRTLSAYTRTREELFNKEKSEALLDLTTKYESEFAAEEQRQQIEKLEIQQQSSNRLRTFLFVVIGLIGLLLGNVYLAFRRKKRANQLLTAKNEEIKQQKAEINAKREELASKNHKLDDLNQKFLQEIAERESIEQSSFARERFLATMSHEMRTPINIITGIVHLLLRENPRPDQIEHFRTLQFSASNLVVFINDILDFSKIEAGKLTLEQRNFSLQDVMKDTKIRFQEKADKDNIALQYEIDSKIPNKLNGDPTRFNQILTNLLTNSLKTSPKGTINTKLELAELNNNKAIIRLTIKDNGHGLSSEKLEQLTRSHIVGNNNDIFEGYNPTDLSLAITKRLVDLQNGRIDVQSSPETGTQFTILLPFKLTIDQLPAKDAVKGGNYDHLAGNRILVVEDNKINQLVVAKLLRKMGMGVVTANDGLEALEVIQQQDFDLVLMDIQMPNMDGYRATAEIRKLEDTTKSNLPIIALTASAFLTEKEKAKLFGMNDHVGKPFSPDDLLEKISKCILIYKHVD